ncbi:unnamed protein product, partial [marine sediment metagenome]
KPVTKCQACKTKTAKIYNYTTICDQSNTTKYCLEIGKENEDYERG